MLAKRFFYVSAALFLLALTYHLGARSATAQAPGNSVVAVESIVSTYVNVVTTNGDVYRVDAGQGGGTALNSTYKGNIFGAPTATSPTTMGRVKDTYRR